MDDSPKQGSALYSFEAIAKCPSVAVAVAHAYADARFDAVVVASTGCDLNMLSWRQRILPS